MTQKEDKERVKTSREELGKFFYRLAEITFTAMVVGATISWFMDKMEVKSYSIVFCIGIVITYAFALLGNRILNKKYNG